MYQQSTQEVGQTVNENETKQLAKIQNETEIENESVKPRLKKSFCSKR